MMQCDSLQIMMYQTLLNNTVQYTLEQYSTVLWNNALQHSLEQCSTVLWNNALQHSLEQCSAVQSRTMQYSTVWYNAVQYSLVQCSTLQYSTVQSRLSCIVPNSTALHCIRLNYNVLF